MSWFGWIERWFCRRRLQMRLGTRTHPPAEAVNRLSASLEAEAPTSSRYTRDFAVVAISSLSDASTSMQCTRRDSRSDSRDRRIRAVRTRLCAAEMRSRLQLLSRPRASEGARARNRAPNRAPNPASNQTPYRASHRTRDRLQPGRTTRTVFNVASRACDHANHDGHNLRGRFASRHRCKPHIFTARRSSRHPVDGSHFGQSQFPQSAFDPSPSRARRIGRTPFDHAFDAPASLTRLSPNRGLPNRGLPNRGLRDRGLQTQVSKAPVSKAPVSKAQGLKAQGLTMQGLKVQGLTMQGLKVQGLKVQSCPGLQSRVRRPKFAFLAMPRGMIWLVTLSMIWFVQTSQGTVWGAVHVPSPQGLPGVILHATPHETQVGGSVQRLERLAEQLARGAVDSLTVAAWIGGISPVLSIDPELAEEIDAATALELLLHGHRARPRATWLALRQARAHDALAEPDWKNQRDSLRPIDLPILNHQTHPPKLADTARIGALRYPWSDSDLERACALLVREALLTRIGTDARLPIGAVRDFLVAYPLPLSNPGSDPELHRRVKRLEDSGRLTLSTREHARKLIGEFEMLRTCAESWRLRHERMMLHVAALADGDEARALVDVAMHESLTRAGWPPPAPRTLTGRLSQAAEPPDPVLASIRKARSEGSPCQLLVEALLSLRPIEVERIDSIVISADSRLRVAWSRAVLSARTIDSWHRAIDSSGKLKSPETRRPRGSGSRSSNLRRFRHQSSPSLLTRSRLTPSPSSQPRSSRSPPPCSPATHSRPPQSRSTWSLLTRLWLTPSPSSQPRSSRSPPTCSLATHSQPSQSRSTWSLLTRLWLTPSPSSQPRSSRSRPPCSPATHSRPPQSRSTWSLLTWLWLKQLRPTHPRPTWSHASQSRQMWWTGSCREGRVWDHPLRSPDRPHGISRPPRHGHGALRFRRCRDPTAVT
jgi:hypothetical protein